MRGMLNHRYKGMVAGVRRPPDHMATEAQRRRRWVLSAAREAGETRSRGSARRAGMVGHEATIGAWLALDRKAIKPRSRRRRPMPSTSQSSSGTSLHARASAPSAETARPRTYYANLS